jgi:predicted DNA-binding transcriptional regulator
MRRGQCYHRERVKLFNSFVDMGLRGLSRSEMAAYVILFRDTQETGLARTSRTEIARRGGMSEKQASRAVQSLTAKGVLHRVCKGYPGKIALYSVFAPDELIKMNPGVKKLLEKNSQKPPDMGVPLTPDMGVQNP